MLILQLSSSLWQGGQAHAEKYSIWCIVLEITVNCDQLPFFCSYVGKTTEQAAELSSPKPVFLTSRKPFRQARLGTNWCWIKDALRMAGMDTGVFSVHSTRSASISWAAAKGISINDIWRLPIGHCRQHLKCITFVIPPQLSSLGQSSNQPLSTGTSNYT